MEYQTNPELRLAYDFLQYTNQNVFLTGKAGTGKTTFLKNLKLHSPKRMIVVAPTGVAAINAGGVTIHSFFQMSFGPQIPVDPNRPPQTDDARNNSVAFKRFSSEKINIIRSLDLLVIDEVSMVRADILDGIDEVLRRYKNRYQPFGGVQLLMIGDLQQLAPVVKDDEWAILRNYYETCFFFSSRALQKSAFVGIELKQIFRQTDQYFIDLLNRVRENKIDVKLLAQLNSRYIPDFNPSDDEGYITLTTHNYQSKQINDRKIEALKTKVQKYKATIIDDFPEYAYPTDEVLELKVGAQVMFVKNDPSYGKRYYNGKIGKLVETNNEFVMVLCPGETEPIRVEPDTWENVKFSLNSETQEIEEQLIGQFIQIPLKLAWAITIHKSQGLTFEKAIIDARQSFAHGQVYVALSRCKSIEGLVLSSPIGNYSVINDNTVTDFTNAVEQNQPGERELSGSRMKYEMQLIADLFDFNPIIRQIQYVLKIWSEHAPYLMGNLRDVLQAMLVPINNEMVMVASKFNPQAEQLIGQFGHVENNELLQVRVKNGATFFVGKLIELVEKPFETVAFQTDNKAIRKSVNDAVDRLEKEIIVKKACLNQIESAGFAIKTYLETKSKAAIEQPSKAKAPHKSFQQTSHPEFFAMLNSWRYQKADELDIEISKVLRQTVVEEIAEKVPSTSIALKAVAGMGGKKMQQFGKELLVLSLQYRKSKGMDVPSDYDDEIIMAGLDTKSITFELFKRGLTSTEIAQKRKLALSTIETHLFHFVQEGVLDVYKLIDAETYNAIAGYMSENKDKTTAEIREALGEKYSYNEIRMVKANMV
jgi:hypothetical protein